MFHEKWSCRPPIFHILLGVCQFLSCSIPTKHQQQYSIKRDQKRGGKYCGKDREKRKTDLLRGEIGRRGTRATRMNLNQLLNWQLFIGQERQLKHKTKCGILWSKLPRFRSTSLSDNTNGPSRTLYHTMYLLCVNQHNAPKTNNQTKNEENSR